MKLYPYQWQHTRRLIRNIIRSKTAGYIGGTGIGKSTVAQLVAGRLRQGEAFTSIVALMPMKHLKEKLKKTDPWEHDLDDTQDHPVYIPQLHIPGWNEWKQKDHFRQEGLYKACYAALTHKNTLEPILEWAEGQPDGYLDGLLLILDEAHHCGGKSGNSLGRLVSGLQAKGASCLLMTATGFRTDGLEVLDMRKNPCVIRSLADQAHDGLAPGTWVFGTHVLEGVPHTNCTPEQRKQAALQVYESWVLEGRPVVIIEVPCVGGFSLEWQKVLIETFRADPLLAVTLEGDPILQAVGPGTAAQNRVADALESEATRIYGVNHEGGLPYDKWLIRVVITAKRFKEGTDLPSASHYFRMGNAPTSLGDVIQSMGRCTRGKFAFEGYPDEFKDLVKVVFFVPGTPPLNTATRKALIQNQLLIMAYLSSMHLSLRGVRHTLAAHRKAKGGPGKPRNHLPHLETCLGKADLQDHERALLMGRVAHEVEKASKMGVKLSLAALKGMLLDEARIQGIDEGAVNDVLFTMLPDKQQQQVLPLLDLGDVLGGVLDQYFEDNKTTLDDKFVFSGAKGGLVEFTSQLTRQDANAVAEVLLQASATDMLSDKEILRILTHHRDETSQKVQVDDKLVVIPDDLKGRLPDKVSGKMLNNTLLGRDDSYVMDLQALWQARPYLGITMGPTRGEVLRAQAHYSARPQGKDPEMRWPTPQISKSWMVHGDRKFRTYRDLKPLVQPRPDLGGHTWMSVQLGLRRGWFTLEPGFDLQTLMDNPPWPGGRVPDPDEVEEALAEFKDTHGHVVMASDSLEDAQDDGQIVWGDYLRVRSHIGAPKPRKQKKRLSSPLSGVGKA